MEHKDLRNGTTSGGGSRFIGNPSIRTMTTPVVPDRARLRKRLGILFGLLIAFGVLSQPCFAETAIISVKSRSASEALSAVQTMLSQEGKAVADVRTNSLIVTDTAETIQKIRAFLAGYDKPVQQVRVRVRFKEDASGRGRSASVSGGVSGRHWGVSTGGGRQNGVEVRLENRKGSRQGTSEYFVDVMSGSPAYIVAGRHILYRERWAYFTRRYAAVGERVVSQRIETGFDVIPVVVGRQANVRIVPRISHMDAHGRRGIIQFTGAATRLTVPLGQWVRIGGTQQQSNEVIRAILASGSASQSSSVVISLKVETR